MPIWMRASSGHDPEIAMPIPHTTPPMRTTTWSFS
eukprot:CAMPEP_0173460928 /NCGR_PEP_ID=MMETSP1357-20121228/64025_1 /TAXON_ID=77926 /ORGANISM="Hemiselmis rufescens, Strain PCC563" /LENGTH=34 /DNA_ID= /DNA_START= /DNA_END= /DNA_ORIENTATION=